MNDSHTKIAIKTITPLSAGWWVKDTECTDSGATYEYYHPVAGMAQYIHYGVNVIYPVCNGEVGLEAMAKTPLFMPAAKFYPLNETDFWVIEPVHQKLLSDIIFQVEEWPETHPYAMQREYSFIYCVKKMLKRDNNGWQRTDDKIQLCVSEYSAVDKDMAVIHRDSWKAEREWHKERGYL
ncbi:hypothetical protein SGGMMB4_03822 [Sodalis glossinidius str. 'morsitans']|uniref:Uncharacterized protein n=1 Tax=Sodalis glossinidius (strain morsitans) TaxID=343509 RepID=A0A193QKS2_SODGM|nr:hypothetical protein [Sodalis glossinidius]CRL45776.1 hypothetical protein SGGMMB4_03822 [Sodalis glossinidius str. 'morsitans']